MPPKRKAVGTRSASKKQRTAGVSSTVVDPNTTISSSESQSLPQQPPINYDQLAAAIIRQSRPIETSQTCMENPQCPSVSPTVAGDQQQTGHFSVPGGQQSTSATGIGALLDQVFLGEPARSAQPVVDFKEGIPLGASVSAKLKTKIWNNEFIDLKSLLDTTEQPLSVTISTGVINLHQGQKAKYPISLSQWTDSFLTFSAIYMEKFPHEGPNLLKYCHMIREMQYLHGDNAFRLYDEQFRKLKESINIPWQNPVQELRLKAATSTFHSPKPQQTQPFRAKICYQFNNKGERCNRSPCPFKHCCLQCRANHPKAKCPELQKYQSTKPAHSSQPGKAQ